jgi:hypothetical protein
VCQIGLIRDTNVLCLVILLSLVGRVLSETSWSEKPDIERVIFPPNSIRNEKAKMTDVGQAIKEIDELDDVYLSCRSVFPKIDKSMIGQTSFLTAPYYLLRGYNVTIDLGQPLTAEIIKKYRQVGNWINENAIIRLYGILHYYNFIGQNVEIVKRIPEWKHVDLCRRIRNCITKSKLNYTPGEDSDNSKLRDEIISFYCLTSDEYEEGEIPTPTDTVIKPMIEGSKKYIQLISGSN